PSHPSNACATVHLGGTDVALKFEHTDRVLAEGRVFKPDRQIVENANVTQYQKDKGFADWESLYAWSIENPEAFWSEQAEALHWFKRWETVKTWNHPYAKWFEGGKCNIVYNALDRHMGTPIQDRVAFYWESEAGQTKAL